jgi:hypothetical protein
MGDSLFVSPGELIVDVNLAYVVVWQRELHRDSQN